MVIQDSVITASTPLAASSRPIRARSRPFAAARYTTATAGSGMKPSSILVLNARPNATALSISQASGCPLPSRSGSRSGRPARNDSSTPQAPRASSRVSIVSGLSSRSIATTTGVRVRASAAIRPAAYAPRSPVSPATLRRTAAYTTATAATPSAACGSSRLQLLNPKIRAEIPIAQNANGGLSTVMNDAESNEPKKNAFQLSVPLSTAAA